MPRDRLIGPSKKPVTFAQECLAISLLGSISIDGIPPTATETAPADGSTVIRGTNLQITVQATDDVAVAGVNILVNGQIVFTATSAPYQFVYTVPLNATTLTIGAQAIDFSNNVGTAKTVIVTAIADPLTTAL